jgi:GNAT superfamily N-acetyltransferase
MIATRVLRASDPECAVLEATGYNLVGVSWAAHLTLPEAPDLGPLQARVAAMQSQGYRIEMLGAEWADALLALETVTNADYPYTPATERSVPTLDTIRALWRPDAWVFGASQNSELVCAGAASNRGDRVEIDFGSVHPVHRRRGVAAAVAAHALMTLADMGFRNFATGGADVNSGSKATVETLGFVIDEVWHSYQAASGPTSP